MQLRSSRLFVCEPEAPRDDHREDSAAFMASTPDAEIKKPAESLQAFITSPLVDHSQGHTAGRLLSSDHSAVTYSSVARSHGVHVSSARRPETDGALM